MSSNMNSVEYVSNIEPLRTFPHGFDCEVFSYSGLIRTRDLLREYPEAAEHVTAIMRADRPQSQLPVENPEGDQSHIRLTLDTLDDYVRIWRYLSDERTE